MAVSSVRMTMVMTRMRESVNVTVVMFVVRMRMVVGICLHGYAHCTRSGRRAAAFASC